MAWSVQVCEVRNGTEASTSHRNLLSNKVVVGEVVRLVVKVVVTVLVSVEVTVVVVSVVVGVLTRQFWNSPRV